MTKQPIANDRTSRESSAADQFLNNPSEESFAALFQVFNPQLVSFFRSRTREFASAEDLAQEVMLTVYSKAKQIRDRSLFRGWLFKIAHNALCRHYGKLSRQVETVNLADVENRLPAGKSEPPGPHAFEFCDWMTFLDAKEREAMIFRFVEQWEYHEIATAQAIPVGTVQWRIFNCKRKLRSALTSHNSSCSVRHDCERRKRNKTVFATAEATEAKKARHSTALPC